MSALTTVKPHPPDSPALSALQETIFHNLIAFATDVWNPFPIFQATTGIMSVEFENVKEVFDELADKPHPCGHILVPCGTDMVFAWWAITDVAEAWNRDPPEGYPVVLRVGTPVEFFEALAGCEEELPVYDLDFQTNWNAYYASRITMKLVKSQRR